MRVSMLTYTEHFRIHKSFRAVSNGDGSGILKCLSCHYVFDKDTLEPLEKATCERLKQNKLALSRSFLHLT